MSVFDPTTVPIIKRTAIIGDTFSKRFIFAHPTAPHVVIMMYDNAIGAVVPLPDTRLPGQGYVEMLFAEPPDVGQYTVVIIG